MAHLHNIYDSDIHFKLDSKTRTFSNETELKLLIAQGDHNSERITFEIPRYIEQHDMLKCNRIEVHYINISSTTRDTSKDVYTVDDAQVSPEDENVVEFSWLLSGRATQYNGTLSFAISMKCLTDEVIDYKWNTLTYEKILVGKSLNNAETIAQEYSDVLEKWKKEVLENINPTVTIDTELNEESDNAIANCTVAKKISQLSDSKANKTYVDGQIAKAQLEGAGVDTSQFVTQDDLKKIADDKANKDMVGTQGTLEDGFLIIKNTSGAELFRVDLAELSGKDFDRKGSISVDVTELTINEGGQITFGVKLANKPTNNQIVNISASNSSVTVLPQELTFTNTNYSEYQTVTVSTVDDEDIGDINGNIKLSSEGVTSVIIALVVTDNDAITYYTMTASDGMTQSAQSKKWIRTYTGTEENVLIPSTMDDLPVNFDNGSYTFTSGTIKNLKFEDGIEYGGNFKVNSSDIKTILNVPSVLTGIDIAAPNLKKITGLENCTNLSKLEIKNTLLEKLPTHNSLDKLTSVNFSLNTNLTDESDFVIPPNVTSIKQLFYSCTNLKKGPVIDRVITTIDHAFTNTALEELVYTEKENKLSLNVIGYNESNGSLTGNLSSNTVLFKVYSDSAMYQNLREKLAKNNVTFEKVSLGVIDEVDLTNVTFWGDSLTRINSNGYGDMCENFNSYFKDTIVSYNNGRAGATTDSAQTLFNAHPERYGDVTVLWLCTNDIPGSGVNVAINNLKEKYIPNLTSEKYIILGTLHFNYNKSDNEAMAQAFGEHFLNIHDYVLENGFDIVGKTPTQDELTSIANDTVPSFFVHTDGNHQNTYSGWVTSTAIKEKLLELGYISSDLLNDCGKVTSINLDKTNLAFIDTNTQTLRATTTPSNATVTWISSDEAIATVNNGVVTPIASGTCYIIAKCGSYSKFCEVTVTLS